jgi:hypothetical protein
MEMESNCLSQPFMEVGGDCSSRLWKWKGTVWVSSGQPFMEMEGNY